MSITGTIVSETFNYDEGRQVTVYVPPAPAEAIVFAGDGQLISQWGETLESANLPPTMIVGVHRVAIALCELAEFQKYERQNQVIKKQ